MAGFAKRNLMMAMLAILIAGGIACAPAHTAWARQDLRPAVANDPGDGVLGDPGDGEDGDPGDGDGVSGDAGDPGDGDERFPGSGFCFKTAHLMMSIIAVIRR